MENSLKEKFNNDKMKQFDISDKDDRNSLTEYVIDNCQFGAMCYNLDKNNKDIIKWLLDNYQGW